MGFLYMTNIGYILLVVGAIFLLKKQKGQKMKYPTATHVSPNFLWSEWTVSANHPDLAARAAEDWDTTTRANAQKVTETILEPLRALIGKPIIILSGYRPVYLNDPSGGVPGSQHITASAADIRVEGGTPEDYEKIYDWAVANRSAFGQFIFYFRSRPIGPGGSHRVHVSIPGNRTGNVKFHGGGYYYKDILSSIA